MLYYKDKTFVQHFVGYTWFIRQNEIKTNKFKTKWHRENVLCFIICKKYLENKKGYTRLSLLELQKNQSQLKVFKIRSVAVPWVTFMPY